MKTGSKITGHKTTSSEGTVFLSGEDAGMVMDGGEIIGNSVTDPGTQPLVNINGGTLTMKTGSKISGHNTTGVFGAVYLSALDAHLEMEGGSISGNNTSSTGTNAVGGVYVSDGRVKMSGGSISDNTKNTIPADMIIHTTYEDRLSMSGSATVGALTLYNYVANPSVFGNILVEGPLTGGNINLSLQSYNPDISEVINGWLYKPVLNAAIGYNLLPADIAKFTLSRFVSAGDVSEIGGAYFIANTGEILASGASQAATVTVSKNSGEARSFITLAGALCSIRTEGDYAVTISANQTLANQYIYVMDARITLYSDGPERIISAGSANKCIFLISGSSTASLNLENNITLQGRADSSYFLVYITNGTLTMQGGSKIHGHKTTAAGTIYLNGVNANLVMQDGEIIGNSAADPGISALVYIFNGRLTMRGTSRISGHNTSSVNGAVVLTDNNAYLIMEGGTITGNCTTSSNTVSSGGVYIHNGYIAMSGGSISGNYQDSTSSGGSLKASDVYVALTTQDRFTMSGSAAVGTVNLYANSAAIHSNIGLSGIWTGSVDELNLIGNTGIGSVPGWWLNKPVLRGVNGYTLTSADVTVFDAALGNFFSDIAGDAEEINTMYGINLVGNEGVLQLYRPK